jgi:hypothetical protein
LSAPFPLSFIELAAWFFKHLPKPLFPCWRLGLKEEAIIFCKNTLWPEYEKKNELLYPQVRKSTPERGKKSV